MVKDFIGYEALADDALRAVVREALRRVAKQGLVGAHHFFITFKTQAPGVDVPPFLQERYPDEMTIVLQNQFWDLNVADDGFFEVTLTFQKVPAALHIPYAAVTAFVDPGVQFGLQFRNSSARVQGQTGAQPVLKPEDKPAETAPPAEQAEKNPASVVSLDKFRKK